MAHETKPTSGTDHETHFDPHATVAPSEGKFDPFPDEYSLVRRLGHGYFGEVWLAADLSPLARPVALKFLRLGGSAQHQLQALDALRNEARVLGSVRHPNIVQVHAWREVARPPMPCLVLQYVSGGSLDNVVRRDGPLPWATAARYVADVADGLLLLHARGLVHRDVKPANILLDPETDEALLTDFGIAARLAEARSAAGTPLFMAPEAHRGETSPALDVFGLAATLFWLAVRQPPFDGHDVATLIASVERGLPAIDPRCVGLPRDIECLLRAGLAARPADRPSLPDFVRDLRGALNLLLADALATTAGVAVNLRLTVERGGLPVAVATRQQEALARDRTRVPAPPPLVSLRTGDRVRVEAVADRPGYLTVFNVGPTGNLNLLHPARPGDAQPLLPANETLRILDVEFSPPAGRERLVAVWTRRPLRRDELDGLAARPVPYRASRDMARVSRSLCEHGLSERQVVVLELDHQ